MPAWFDLLSLDPNGKEDVDGIKKAFRWVETIIEEEINAQGIPPGKIVLGGFSQGGALALLTGLTIKHKLAGILALSCWLPTHKEVPRSPHLHKNVSILQCHGDCDPVVPYKVGQLTSTLLKSMSITDHEFKTYRGLGHSSSDDELTDVGKFLTDRLQK